MRSKQVVSLISYETRSNNFSDEGKKILVYTDLYANNFSLSSTQQLQAQHEGLRTHGKVEVWTFEYNGQPDIRINNKIYTILSVEEKGDKTILTYGERLSK